MTYQIDNVASDIDMPLGEFKAKVDAWVEKYGEDSVISTDAGHNNCEINIEYEPSQHD